MSVMYAMDLKVCNSEFYKKKDKDLNIYFFVTGAMVSIYGMDRAKLQCDAMYCHFRSPKKFLEEMSMDKAEYWIDAVALIGIFIALRIIAYFVLRWKLHMIR